MYQCIRKIPSYEVKKFVETVKPHVSDGSWVMFLLLSMENSLNSILTSGSKLYSILKHVYLTTGPKFSIVLRTALDSQTHIVIQNLSSFFQERSTTDHDTKVKVIPFDNGDGIDFEIETPNISLARELLDYQQSQIVSENGNFCMIVYVHIIIYKVVVSFLSF